MSIFYIPNIKYMYITLLVYILNGLKILYMYIVSIQLMIPCYILHWVEILYEIYEKILYLYHRITVKLKNLLQSGELLVYFIGYFCPLRKYYQQFVILRYLSTILFAFFCYMQFDSLVCLFFLSQIRIVI